MRHKNSIRRTAKEQRRRKHIGDLVKRFFAVTRIYVAFNNREMAMCRDEVIRHNGKKVIGFIEEETPGHVVIKKVAKNGNVRHVTVRKSAGKRKTDARLIIPRRFDDPEEARREIFRWPVGKREADVSSLVFDRMRGDIKLQISRHLPHYPLWTEWLVRVTGVGPVGAGCHWAWLEIERCKHCSSLWAYTGHHAVPICDPCGVRFPLRMSVCPNCGGEPTRSVMPRLQPGVKRTWNRDYQVGIWNTGKCLRLQSEGYRAIFDEYREVEAACSWTNSLPNAAELAGYKLRETIGKFRKGRTVEDKETAHRVLRALKDAEGALRPILVERTDGHQTSRAMRTMRKVYLAHTYQMESEIHGLPYSKPYIIDGNHTREFPVVFDRDIDASDYDPSLDTDPEPGDLEDLEEEE